MVILKEKTVAMIFTRQNQHVIIIYTEFVKTSMNSNVTNKIMLGEPEVGILNEATYLGITFNRKRKWGTHIKNKIYKAIAKKKLF